MDKPPDMTELLIEFRSGQLFIDNVSCGDFAELTDEWIEKVGFQTPQALAMLCEMIASQAAFHDASSDDTYYLEFASAMLGMFYKSRRAHIALQQAVAPPKHKQH